MVVWMHNLEVILLFLELQEHNKRLNAKNASLQEVEVQMTAALEIEQVCALVLSDEHYYYVSVCTYM